jgi:diacylglycerol kinase family enzyme
MLSSFVQGELFRRIVSREFLSIATDQDENFRHGTLSLLCATVPFAPFKRRLFPEALHSREHLHLVSVTQSPEELVLRFLPDYILFPASFRAGKLRLASRCFTVTSDAPIPYTLDGELYLTEGNEVQISCGPKLTFLVV